MVQFARNNPSLVIPKPDLSARNLLASSETADSSRDKAALRNDNSPGILKFHHHSFLAPFAV
jgi:hypothetical protein